MPLELTHTRTHAHKDTGVFVCFLARRRVGMCKLLQLDGGSNICLPQQNKRFLMVNFSSGQKLRVG